jgi:hypothetical protein
LHLLELGVAAYISFFVDATAFHLGKDITIYFSSCNPSLSSSLAWDISAGAEVLGATLTHMHQGRNTFFY